MNLTADELLDIMIDAERETEIAFDLRCTKCKACEAIRPMWGDDLLRILGWWREHHAEHGGRVAIVGVLPRVGTLPTDAELIRVPSETRGERPHVEIVRNADDAAVRG